MRQPWSGDMRDQIDSDRTRSLPLSKAERGSWISNLGAHIFLNVSLKEPCLLALLVGKEEGCCSGLGSRVFGQGFACERQPRDGHRRGILPLRDMYLPPPHREHQGRACNSRGRVRARERARMHTTASSERGRRSLRLFGIAGS
jgi:hypothetical protein